MQTCPRKIRAGQIGSEKKDLGEVDTNEFFLRKCYTVKVDVNVSTVGLPPVPLVGTSVQSVEVFQLGLS